MIDAAPADFTMDNTSLAFDALADACIDATDAGDQPDVVLSFTPIVSGDHTITIPNYVSNVGASIIYVKDGCDAGDTCINQNDFFLTQELVVALTAGVHYTLIVTSDTTAEIGANTFHIEGPAVMQ